jgi:hypothetical protein
MKQKAIDLLKKLRGNVKDLTFASIGVIILAFVLGLVTSAAYKLFMLGWSILN